MENSVGGYLKNFKKGLQYKKQFYFWVYIS